MELIPYAFALFAILAIALGIYGWKQAQQRREALRALARELGCSFSADHDGQHDDRYSQFAAFQRGHSRYAYNTLRGSVTLFERSCRVVAGDFHYATDDADGKSTTSHTFSFLLVHPPWPTPTLLVRPEGMFDKLKGALGFDDIDFESDEFSKRFWVQSPDKRFAFDVLHPRMMEFLLAERPPVLELEGGVLCVGDGRAVWCPAMFRAQFEFLDRFAALWPRHLLQDLEK